MYMHTRMQANLSARACFVDHPVLVCLLVDRKSQIGERRLILRGVQTPCLSRWCMCLDSYMRNFWLACLRSLHVLWTSPRLVRAFGFMTDGFVY